MNLTYHFKRMKSFDPFYREGPFKLPTSKHLPEQDKVDHSLVEGVPQYQSLMPLALYVKSASHQQVDRYIDIAAQIVMTT